MLIYDHVASAPTLEDITEYSTLCPIQGWILLSLMDRRILHSRGANKRRCEPGWRSFEGCSRCSCSSSSSLRLLFTAFSRGVVTVRKSRSYYRRSLNVFIPLSSTYLLRCAAINPKRIMCKSMLRHQSSWKWYIPTLRSISRQQCMLSTRLHLSEQRTLPTRQQFHRPFLLTILHQSMLRCQLWKPRVSFHLQQQQNKYLNSQPDRPKHDWLNDHQIQPRAMA